MARRHRRKSKRGKLFQLCLAVCAVALVLIIGTVGAQILESRLTVRVENAGQQMTAHTDDESAAQVFMNGQWYQKKSVETLLLIGIDDLGTIAGSDSYNNSNQADFMMLFVRNAETGESTVIHLNRDTMTDITVLGVTGESAGVEYAQLALAYNYGQGQGDSSRNTMKAVSNLLYGMEVDHYITMTMDAVPVLNNWVGGVKVTVMDDLTSVDRALVLDDEVKLTGEQALAYVRTRKGLDDSSNINRMKRQRQYAAAWIDLAREQIQDQKAAAQLVTQMNSYYYSDCTAEELAEFMEGLGETAAVEMIELPGEAVRGEQYMEFYADDEEIQKIVLEVFYRLAQ